MATYTLNELGRTLRAQLAEIVSGGDQTTVAKADSFINWCTPGIPFEAADFDFAAKGLNSAADAEGTRKLLNQAFVFSTFADFIPDVSGLVTLDKQVAVFRTSQARLSHMYGEILRLSKVIDKELTPDNKQKLEAWGKQLRVTTKVRERDVVTHEIKEKIVTDDSKMVKEYDEFAKKFEDARLEYNNKRILAAVATGPEGQFAVNDFSANQTIYRDRVNRAIGAWEASGHKSDVERLRAAIGQMTARSMKLWKQRLLNDLDDARISAIGPGQSFLYTLPVPGNFANASGWTGYSVYSNTFTSEMQQRSSSWSAGGSVGWGFWRASAGVQSSSSDFTENTQVSNFKLSFDLAQIPIARPWFSPEFFMNRGWTLDRGRGWNFDQFPSDGGNPPVGNFVGYPTTILFARNIVIQSSEFASAFRSYSRSVSGSGSFGWGCFTLGGSYSSQESGRKFSSSDQGQSITVPGMQILGFVNRLIPKSPNPFEDLKPQDFE